MNMVLSAWNWLQSAYKNWRGKVAPRRDIQVPK